MVGRLCAVSVDLDEIPNYFGIYGLADPTGPEKSLVYDVAVDRLRDFASSASLPLTLFAIGRDLARPEAAAKLRVLRDRGVEIANHSLDHRYDLSRAGPAEILRQILEGAIAIERATGTRPAGFRAPGYTITDEVFDALAELEVRYDSSVFPCPAYWAAKTAAIALIGLRGRTSRSIVDPAGGLEALRPHQPDVRVAKEQKLDALSAAVEVLRRAGYAFVTLQEAAEAA